MFALVITMLVRKFRNVFTEFVFSYLQKLLQSEKELNSLLIRQHDQNEKLIHSLRRTVRERQHLKENLTESETFSNETSTITSNSSTDYRLVSWLKELNLDSTVINKVNSSDFFSFNS